MHRSLHRTTLLALATVIAAVVASTGTNASAQQDPDAPPPVRVIFFPGSDNGCHNPFVASWAVINNTGFELTITNPATQTAIVGGLPQTSPVTLTPNPIPAAPDSFATGLGQPVAVDSLESLTLAVHWSYQNGDTTVTGTEAGVPGGFDCIEDTTVAPPTTPTTRAPAVTVAPAVATTPAFTG